MSLLSRPLRYALAAMLIVASIPASATVWKWSQTASSNSNSDATINWAEGMAPSAVNDSARAVMAAIAKWRDDLSGAKPSNAIIEVGGSATAYTLTSNQSLTSLTNGFTVTFRVGSGLTNTGSLTLAVDGLTAKGVNGINGTALTGGELVEGSIYTATYFATADVWLLHNFYAGSAATPPGSIQAYAGTSAPSGWLLLYGQAISRTTYSALFAVISTTYGSGDGSTTFNVPDLRGRVIAGQDDAGGSSANRLTDAGDDSLNGDTLGDTGGSETETLDQGELDAHTHSDGSYAVASHQHTNPTLSLNNATSVVRSASGVSQIGEGGSQRIVLLPGATTSTISISGQDNTGSTAPDVSGTSGETGSNTPFAKVQPTIILNYIIKI